MTAANSKYLETGVFLQVLVLIHMVHLVFLVLNPFGLLGIWNFPYRAIAYWGGGSLFESLISISVYHLLNACFDND